MNRHPAEATFDGNPSGRPALSQEEIATFDAAMQLVRFEELCPVQWWQPRSVERAAELD